MGSENEFGGKKIWKLNLEMTGKEGKEKGGCLRVLKGHSTFVNSVAILVDKENQLCKSEVCVISGSYDSSVGIWDTKASNITHNRIKAMAESFLK